MEEEGPLESDHEMGSTEFNEKKWECFACCEVFPVKGSLTRHLATHRAERPHKCQFCGSCFRRPDHLYQHHKAIHPTELLKFECDECHEVFNTKGKLRLHKIEHVGAHQCDFCGRIFTKKQFLTVHKKTHTGDKPYCCEYCFKSFTSKYFLGEHRKRHTEETPFKCEICKIYFQKESSLRGHHTKQHMFADDVSSAKKGKKLKVHYNSTESVGLTNQSYEKELDLCQDTGEEHKEKLFECDTNNKLFDSKTILVEHKQSCVGQEPPITCDLCGEVFCDAHNLRLHKQAHSEQEVKSDMKVNQENAVDLQNENVGINNECPICHVKLNGSFQLQKHLSSHNCNEMHQLNSDETSLICNTCGMIFLSKRCIQEHECKGSGIRVENVSDDVIVVQGNKIAENTVCDYTCKICGEKYIEKSLLSAHLVSHTSKDGYNELGINSENTTNTEQSPDVVYINNDTSLVNVVTITDRKYYECDVCHKQFTTNSYLNVHKRIHNGVKPHSCEYCGKHFTAKCNLKIHIRLHTGEKPYTCELCNKQFSDMSARNSHRRSHIANGDFDHKQLTTNSYLNVHKQAHSDVKPHTCEFCGKHFTMKCNLKVHIRLHTGEKPYTCEVCDKRFSDMTARNSHSRSHVSKK